MGLVPILFSVCIAEPIIDLFGPPQPFDDYCITRKELHELLKKHHKTAIELEREKEEKLR